MHGDFSRGHRPDGKRGESYLRGFAQQRRLLLDSDLNAMTDALHERLRVLSRHVACPKGSPDLGYLVTPGRLLAVFRELDGVVTASSNVTYYRDYQRKYLDRYPSLRVAADQGVAGAVTVRLRAEANGDTVFWCRSEAATTVTLSGGVPLNVPAGDDLQAVTVNLATVQDLQITLDAGEEIWIGLIESRQTATLGPRFDFASGYYYLNGLPLRNPADATWASNLIPPPANFQVDNPLRNLAANDRLLAYLEGWERHITAVEDPGVLENALGGDTDTTTRGRSTGQVKLAWVPANFDLEAFAEALCNPVLADGTLNVTTPPADPNPDPCALPVQGGYTGRDNRFYRFEVHTGGALGDALLKWSRDNGAELFAVVEATDQTLTFPANTLLQPGDLVEVLTAETIELGDASPATLDGASDSFTPSVKAVGRLARLQASTSSGTGVTFSLREPDGVAVVTLAPHFGPFPSNTLKVRRWHGLIDTTAAPVPNVHEIENGIEIELEGSFSPGDYWQYEARAGSDNANGPFQTSPHGPERSFGPLALLQFTASNQPLLLERWLDDRFPPLCELTADDIYFDGDRIGTDSDTVQEVIEELWERTGGGCCEFTLQPPQGDAGAAITDILQDSQGEVKICLEPGIYNFTTTVEITGRKVGLKGCPRAVLVATGNPPLFHVTDAGRLQLEDVILFSRSAEGARVLVDMENNAFSLEAHRTGFFAAPDPQQAAANTLAVRVGGQEPSPVDPLAPVPLTAGGAGFSGPDIRMRDCAVAASWGISAVALLSVDIAGSHFGCGAGCLWAERLFNTSIRDSDLLAGLNLSLLQGWTPEELLQEARAEQFVRELVPALDFISPAAASLSLRARRLALGSISGCRLAAGVGLALTNTSVVKLQGNVYAVSHTGAYVVEARETSVAGESFLFSGSGSGAHGVQLLMRGGFSMTDCTVSHFRVGVALGAESAGANPRSFLDVQIQNNQIDFADVGIQVGTADLNGFTGELRQVAITENNVTTQAVGILINAPAAAVPGGPQGTILLNHARVADNVITARLGIGVSGGRVALNANRIRLVIGSGTRFGIVASNTFNLVCEGNQVELQDSSGSGGVSFANPLPDESAATAGAFGPYIAAGAKTTPAGIQLSGGSGARIAGNVIQSERFQTLAGLAAENHPLLAAKENKFLSGPVACNHTDEIVFLGNAVSDLVQIISSRAGMVCDNRVRWLSSDALGNLLITSASGNWKVSDNRVDGLLRVQPSIRFTFGNRWLSAFNRAAAFSPPVFGALAAIDVLADNPQFNAALYPAARETGLVNRANVEAVNSPDPVPGAAAYAMSNADWMASYNASIADFVLEAASEFIGNVGGANVGDIIIVVAAASTEELYQAQCTDNWAGNIEVGSTGAQTAGNALSAVQVVSNRAEGSLSVRSYPRLIIALNMARQYPLAGSASPQAVVAPNLLI